MHMRWTVRGRDNPPRSEWGKPALLPVMNSFQPSFTPHTFPLLLLFLQNDCGIYPALSLMKELNKTVARRSFYMGRDLALFKCILLTKSTDLPNFVLNALCPPLTSFHTGTDLRGLSLTLGLTSAMGSTSPALAFKPPATLLSVPCLASNKLQFLIPPQRHSRPVLTLWCRRRQ